MHDTKSRAIVLAGNQNFTAQLSTTIKSIFYHNKDVKIYVLNRDIQTGFENHGGWLSS